MGVNFPSSPNDGQAFSLTSGPIFLYYAAKAVWRRNSGTALPTNKVVNPAMQISQQNGDNSSTAIGYYMADQWQSVANQPHTWQRVAATTPRGSKYRLRVVVGTAMTNTSMEFLQVIEMSRLQEFNYGTANAIYSVLRFGMKGPAGQYAIYLQDALFGNSIIFPVNLPDQVDTEFTFVVPPCTIGSWPTAPGSMGARLSIAPSMLDMRKTSTIGTWLAGDYRGITGMSDGADTLGKTFEIFDVGWYADPLKTGVAPEFQIPDYADDLSDCQRYWYKSTGARGMCNATTTLTAYAPHFVPMRTTPSLTLVGTVRAYDGTTTPNVTSVAVGVTTDDKNLVVTCTTTGLVLGRAGGLLVDANEDNYIAVSAR